MSEWAPKRFWKDASTEAVPGGYTVRLDARGVKTPAKTPLVVPTLAMAMAIADEWQAQEGLVRPHTMPLTRMANSALDKVTPLHAQVVAEVAGFGGSDLLCYRAAGPEDLAARQRQGWDPLLDWSALRLDAPLFQTAGVIHIGQPADSLARLTQHVAAQDAFRLTALHDLVAITGSLVLGLAVARQRLSADEAWALSRLDEDWQAEQWGIDEEAAEQASLRHAALLDAARFYGLCG